MAKYTSIQITHEFKEYLERMKDNLESFEDYLKRKLYYNADNKLSREETE